MAPLTIYLSRLIGLLTLIAALSMLADKPQAIDTVRAVVEDRPALLILGMLGTAAGLAVVLGHEVWSGGVLPVLVTAIGWIVLIRGTILLFLSQHATTAPRRLVSLRRFLLSLPRICCGPGSLSHRSWVQRRCCEAGPGNITDGAELQLPSIGSHSPKRQGR
jgi:hypothetical protein